MSEVSILELELQNEKPTVSNPVEAVVSAAIDDMVTKVGTLGFMNKKVLGWTKNQERIECVKFNTHTIHLTIDGLVMHSESNNNFVDFVEKAKSYMHIAH